MQDVISLNRLADFIDPAKNYWVVQMDAITRSAVRMHRRPEVWRKEVVQQIRIERVKQARSGNLDHHLKEFLVGDTTQLRAEDAKTCYWIASDYKEEESGLLLFCPRQFGSAEDCEDDPSRGTYIVAARISASPFQSLEGGHHGIRRSYQRSEILFHYSGLYRSVQ